MKLQIDTELKIIKIEENVNLGEFIGKLDLLFPNDGWKEYKLEVTIINNFTNPIVINDYNNRRLVPNPYPGFPIIYCGEISGNYTPQTTYNISL